MNFFYRSENGAENHSEKLDNTVGNNKAYSADKT